MGLFLTLVLELFIYISSSWLTLGSPTEFQLDMLYRTDTLANVSIRVKFDEVEKCCFMLKYGSTSPAMMFLTLL